MNTWINKNWLKIAAAVMLAGALGNIPFTAYYQMMNWVTLGAAIMTAWEAYKRGNVWMTWIFILVGVVFNPIAPLYLRTDVWKIADLVAAALFLISLFVMRKSQNVTIQ